MPDSIQPSGDVQLFVVNGGQGEWSLPIFATPYVCGDPPQDFFLVTPALPLMKNASDALLSVLLPQCHSREERTGGFWFPRAALPLIAEKCAGITPKFYWKWENKMDTGRLAEAVVEFHEPEDLNSDQEKFLRFLVNKTPLVDMTQARIFWKAMVQWGAVWLARDKKPIDFGLFTMTPLPYRRNWKERIYEMMLERVRSAAPKAFIHAMKLSRPERDAYVQREMPDLFNDTTLMDVDYAKHYCHWHLEMAESKLFKKFSAEVDSEVRHSRGPVPYADKIVRQIQTRHSSILDALSAWVKEISRPCGAVEQKRMDRGQSIVPLKKPGQLLPISPRHSVVPVVVDDKPQLCGPSAGQKLDETVKIGLREMHYLLSANGDMRDSGEGDGASLDERVDRAKRLPLHARDEGDKAGVKMLASGDHGKPDQPVEQL